jgi:hypothetical protein
MLSLTQARDRAVRRAIETGELANMDFIHMIQRAEGFQPCFGLTENRCFQGGCRWHPECVALAETRTFARESSLS